MKTFVSIKHHRITGIEVSVFSAGSRLAACRAFDKATADFDGNECYLFEATVDGPSQMIAERMDRQFRIISKR